MAVQNTLAPKGKQNQRFGITAYLTQDAVKKQINNVIGGKDGQRFISAIVSAVNTNTALQECTNQSILSGALLGESLKLSPSPQLGHYYLVPYNDKEKGKVAQFQLGYKGYIQLAIRSGQYKKLNVMAIKEGELEFFDPLNEDIKINLMVDSWDAREEAPTIGYYAFFELTNGFRKAIYWSKIQMMSHADKFSSAFSASGTTIRTRYGEKKKVSFADYEAGNYDPADAWMYSSFWYRNFDEMAYKTMLRQLISKWGIMSIELQNAIDGDMAVINEDGSKDYVENDDSIIDMEEPEEPKQAESAQELQKVSEAATQPTDAPMDAQAALFGGR